MRDRLTYANVMATIAVFIALGGSSYAAIKLPNNAVKARNIAANAVTGAKVENRSLTRLDFGLGQLPQGAVGAQGATGADGSTGPVGPTGARGLTGADGSPDTPAQVLTKLAQVDGPGSGLDADTVDGADASGLQKRVAGTCPAASFINAVASDGTVQCGRYIAGFVNGDGTVNAGSGFDSVRTSAGHYTITVPNGTFTNPPKVPVITPVDATLTSMAIINGGAGGAQLFVTFAAGDTTFGFVLLPVS
jgi:hypothetical protein